MKPAGTHSLTAVRGRNARRAALAGGLFFGGVALKTAGDATPLSDIAPAWILLAVAGAALGAGAVYADAVWPAADGRWHISPIVAALAVGTPAAALAGALTLGTPLSGRGAAMAAAGWIGLVLALRLALRIRAARRGRFA